MPTASARWPNRSSTIKTTSSSSRRSSDHCESYMAAAIQQATAQPILTLTRVRKSFGGAHALRDANLALYPGQVTALIGENGAGKSTLVKILCGVHQPDGGEIVLDGRTVRVHDPEHARQLGINVVHQE